MGDEIRISDGDRERVIERLRFHTGEGRLTLDEFSDRVEVVLRASTAAELEPLLRDLPAPAGAVPAVRPGAAATPPAAAPARQGRRDRRGGRTRVVAIMSGEERRGRWRLRRNTTAVAIMGGVSLDLRRAELEGAEIEIRCWAIMGGVDVIVPEGIPVECSGFVLMGGRTDRIADVPPLPGAPTIRVKGYGMWGGVTVRSRKPGQRGMGEAVSERVRDAIESALDAIPAPPVPPPPPYPRHDLHRSRDRGRPRPRERDRIQDHREGRRPRPRRSAPQGTVSILVTDIVGSTSLAERLGDQAWLEVLREHNAIVRHHIDHFGGTEVKQQGDGFLVTFPSARDAVRAAIAVRRSIEAYRDLHLDAPLRLRQAVHAGEVEREGADVFGVNVSTAARLADLADPDEVLVSGVVADLADSTSDLRFEPAREVAVAGRSVPVRVHRVACD